MRTFTLVRRPQSKSEEAHQPNGWVVGVGVSNHGSLKFDRQQSALTGLPPGRLPVTPTSDSFRLVADMGTDTPMANISCPAFHGRSS